MNLKVNLSKFMHNHVYKVTKKRVLAGMLLFTMITVNASDIKNKTYTIHPGDSLWNISKEFYGDGDYWLALMEYNNITDEKLVLAGKELIIPPKSKLESYYENRVERYTISLGDSMWSICKRYYNDGRLYEKLIEYNYNNYGISINPDKLKVGMVIYLPTIENLKEKTR